MKLLTILLCKGTGSPVSPPFKMQEAVPHHATPFRRTWPWYSIKTSIRIVWSHRMILHVAL